MAKMQSAARRVSQRLAIPEEGLSDVPRITISGSSHVQIEGHHGLLEYSEERIAAAGRKSRIVIKGEMLRLEAMDERSLVVTGTIWAVEQE